MKLSAQNFKKGFTLIELLVVVAVIAALAVSVFVALNPSARIIAANDARRTSDADSILSAVHQYIVDNDGTAPASLPAAGTERQLGTGTAVTCATALVDNGCSTPASTACADMSTDLAPYLKTMPIDPLGGTTYTSVKTGYSITQDSNGIVTVKACGAQGTADISVSR